MCFVLLLFGILIHAGFFLWQVALLIAHLAQCVFVWIKSCSASASRSSRRQDASSSFVSEAGVFVESGLILNSAHDHAHENGGPDEFLITRHETDPFEELELRRPSDAFPDSEADPEPAVQPQQQSSQVPLLLPRVAASVSEQCVRAAVAANGPVERSRGARVSGPNCENGGLRESFGAQSETRFKSVEFGKRARKRAFLSAQWRAAIAQARLAATLFLPALIILSLLYYITQGCLKDKLFDSFYFGYITISTIGMEVTSSS